ncbi:MAG: multicopper oxidase family protein, partial [Myxococcales bacterium]|nr:multicopper oxidase family protein [Myxococcales bacterium]
MFARLGTFACVAGVWLLAACGDDGPTGGAGGEAPVGGAGGAGGEVVLPPLPPIEGLPVLEDLNPEQDIVEVELVARPGSAELLDGGATDLLTYNDSLPGPLLHARVGDRVIVHFTNELDEPTTIHWHGLRISDLMDGSPMIQNPVEPGETFTYDFVVPDAGTFWYHTHLHQIEQFERGLYGALVVHELEFPTFSAERLIVIDDIRLDEDNQVAPFNTTSGPDVGMGRVGNTLLVNGRGEPLKLSVPAGGIERWRIVLATNSLNFGLRLQGADARVIGTDGGLLPEGFDLERVEFAPGQRYDLEVRPRAGEDITLEALILQLDENNQVVEVPFALVDATVEGEVTPEEPVYPLVELPSIDVDAPMLNWNIAGGVVDGEVVFTINGEAGFVGDGHEHVILETFEPNVPVKIKLRSNVSPAHPFHIHGQFFQIIEREGEPITDEPGLRDTVHVRGADSVTI